MGIVGGDLGVNGCMELEKHKFRLKRLRLFLFLVRGVFVYGIVGYVKANECQWKSYFGNEY